MAEKLRLMCVHAHPDDESSKGAASTARYVAEGVDVHVATCTGGERGSILNPQFQHPGIEDNPELITDIRREEMDRAREILGVTQDWLGFVDSGWPDGDPKPPLPEDCFALVPIDSRADGINDFGQVVGGLDSFCDFCPGSAFLYSDGLITDLSLLAPVVAAGWTQLTAAVDINNHGQIVGWGRREDSPGGGSRAFMLSPIVAIPEPETYAMLLIGLGLLSFVSRHRKAKHLI